MAKLVEDQKQLNVDTVFYHRVITKTKIRTKSIKDPTYAIFFDTQVSLEPTRHDFCQNFYATAVLGARILRKKCVNSDITQFPGHFYV